MKFTLSLILFGIVIIPVFCYNKYSKEANILDKESEEVNVKSLKAPFRMQKINLLWEKAKIRLSEPKLRSLYGELKTHDKEEVTWKHIKADGKDKDGMKEGELRKKLLSIMSMYGLLEHFESTGDAVNPPKPPRDNSDSHINKSMFKDKKLNKLWARAEMAGFTTIELQALREEFNHHQDKIDQYYSILGEVKDGEPDEEEQHENSIDNTLERFNMLETGEVPQKQKQDYIEKANSIRDQHNDIRDGFDRLHHLASRGPNSKEFVEPKVQGLWKIALESNFLPAELESLRVELRHYEDRLLKLRHLQVEAAISQRKQDQDLKLSGVKSDGIELMESHIKKQTRKVEKIHLDLETRIMQKHIEL